MSLGVAVSLVLLGAFARAMAEAPKPNIIVIVADDMGWNDVGFHGSNQIPTPNIDALAYNGVILNSFYAQALCTPSRSSFLTGKYPTHVGMQHLVILEPEPWGLPLTETILPQHLKRAGYTTHAVGKWHLGFFRREYTPTYRGFDTHFGYWNGLQDYYTHEVHATYSNMSGYDMRRNMNVDYDARGQYSTDLFTAEAVKLVREHDVTKPMFLYLAHLAPHTGNSNDPLQAPDEEVAKFAHIPDPERRIYAAMVSMLDRSVGTVISALRERHMLENSIILFMSDNGAQTFGVHANHGSNYPLRGMKASSWEGGNKVAAAIWSPLLKHPKRVSNQLMHVSDWLPTLYSAAGMDVKDLGKIDGIDMWDVISENKTSPRTDVLYNIDDIFNYSAVRRGDFKYVIGSIDSKKDQWYGDSGLEPIYEYDMASVLKSPTANSLAGIITSQQIEEKRNSKSERDLPDFVSSLLTVETAASLREQATVKCPERNSEEVSHAKCDPTEAPCLFNLRDDPCESINLAQSRPLILVNMENVLMQYRRTAVKPNNVPEDPNANPALWNNTWVNWQDFADIQAEKINWPLSQTTIVVISVVTILFFFVIMIIIAVSVKKRSSKKFKGKLNMFDDHDQMDSPASIIQVINESTSGKHAQFETEMTKRDSSKNIN